MHVTLDSPHVRGISEPFICTPPRFPDLQDKHCPAIDARKVSLVEDLWLSYSGKPPQEILHEIELYQVFEKAMPNMWVRDPMTGMILPYWVPPQVHFILALAQNKSLSSYPMPLLQWLHESRISVPPAGAQSIKEKRESDILKHRESLQTKGYTVLRNLFPRPMLKAMTRRIRHMQEEKLLVECEQVRERTRVTDEPVQTYYHLQLQNYLNRIMEDSIKASYVFTAIYHEGAVLARHKDRKQCRWNLSMVLDATPEITMETAWPIYMEIDEKVVGVNMLPGDAVLYSGTDIPHWRDAQPPGMETVVSFFHFVDKSFQGDLK